MKESANEKSMALVNRESGDVGGKNILTVTVAAVAAVLALALFLCTGIETFGTPAKVFLSIGGVLLIAFAVQFLLYVYVFGEQKVNYFLYQADTGRSIPPSELDDRVIDARLDSYLSAFVKNKAQLWLPGGIEQCDFGKNDCFRPAVAYKMLTDLARTDSEGAWKCFCGAAPATVKWVADSLKDAEPRMSQDLLAVKARFSSDPARVRQFVKGNEKYLRNRLVAYVTENLSLFDGIGGSL